jgi:carboxyl-terminal processing protease
MMRNNTIRYIAFILIAGILGYYLGVNKVNLDWKNFHPQITVTSKEPPRSNQSLDMSKFWAVYEKISTDFYNKKDISAQKMLDGAISGMVNSLDDPYTVYLPPTQNSNFKEVLAGQFSGVGAELGLNDKQIIVVAPIDGSPAQKAGIKAGDAIIKVNNDFTQSWTLDQAVTKIRGPKGTDVTLTVIHKNEKDQKKIAIVRDTITIKSVTSWVKDTSQIDSIKGSSAAGLKTPTPTKNDSMITKNGKKVAYVRLSQFGDNTNQEWLSMSNALALQMQKDSSIKGIVLDIRNNPGGYVTDAVFIASEFLKVGTPVVIQDMGMTGQETLSVKRNGLLLDVPLVVLINKGSASASEIVAGALRDAGRARLVGEQSFGKGTMQNADDLGEGAGLHVTIARWLTPKGTWVGNGKNGTGLTPDDVIELNSKDPTLDTQLQKAVDDLTK